jgi:hypothetical protein
MYYSRLGCLPAFSDMDYTFWFPDKLIGVLKPQNKCLFRSIFILFFYDSAKIYCLHKVYCKTNFILRNEMAVGY